MIWLIIGLVAGFVAGVLFGRKNRKTVEQFVDKVDALDIDDKIKEQIRKIS